MQKQEFIRKAEIATETTKAARPHGWMATEAGNYIRRVCHFTQYIVKKKHHLFVFRKFEFEEYSNLESASVFLV
jgi:hypothetical protein